MIQFLEQILIWISVTYSRVLQGLSRNRRKIHEAGAWCSCTSQSLSPRVGSRYRSADAVTWYLRYIYFFEVACRKVFGHFLTNERFLIFGKISISKYLLFLKFFLNVVTYIFLHSKGRIIVVVEYVLNVLSLKISIEIFIESFF